MKIIKVFIVDDSAVVRQVLSMVLTAAPGIEVVGIASDPIYAEEKMISNWPDVVVLDIEMPRMDGLSFLKKLMVEHPTPVVICSTLTEKGAQTTIQALEAGAVSVVTKPKVGLKSFLENSSSDIVAAVRAAAMAKVSRFKSPPMSSINKKNVALLDNSMFPSTSASAMAQTTERIVAIGTSTGGTQALEAVLKPLPRVCSGIVIVQHMPEKFTAAFAARLNDICNIEVKEAQHNDRVLVGRALIAPGGKHMLLKRSGAQYFVEVINGPPVNRHTPSVDVLFRSVAKVAGKNALGIIMTGMGDDGAAGLLEMKQASAATIAQDEASSIVFGMPKEAIKRDAALRIMGLSAIPAAIMEWHRQ